MKKILTMILSAALVLSCGSAVFAAETKTKKAEVSKTVQDPFVSMSKSDLLEDGVVLGKPIQYVKKDYNGKVLFADVAIKLPQFDKVGKNGAEKKINAFFNSQLKGFKNETNQFINIPKKDKDEETKKEYFANYTYNVDYRVRTSDKGYLSVYVYSTSYTGGAHGSHAMQAYVFRISDGKQVSLSSLFKVGEDVYKQRLCEETYKAVKQHEGYLDKYGFGDFEKGTYKEELAQLTKLCYPVLGDGNFELDDNSITLIYNEYDIGPYVSGPTYVKIPFSAIKDILK